MANRTSVNITLEDLNHEEMVKQWHLLFFLTLLLIFGLPGNITVLVIFLNNYKKEGFRVYRIFVVSLATLDMTACCFCIPFEISDIIVTYTFYNDAACKILRTLELFIIMATVWVILCLSFFRYWENLSQQKYVEDYRDKSKNLMWFIRANSSFVVMAG